jgi:galactose mutarotase-like enzyme
MYTITNEALIVTLNPRGAEVLSIFSKQTQLDYLWNGDPAFWPKTSPVLFPIVGGLKENTYFYNGETYHLGRHGFGRESLYEVTAQTENSITFTLNANETTLKVYPFLFTFSVKYELSANKLSVSYLVENTGKEDLLFSVGGHPAFKVPLAEGTTFTDYYLQFSEKETTGRYRIDADGLIEKSSTPLLTDADILPLKKELFYNDALVLKNLQSNSISLASDKTPNGLKVQFDHFPYLGIWQATDANFVCIEPWCGLGDTEDTTSQLQKKEGINTLQSAGIFTRTWSVEVY